MKPLTSYQHAHDAAGERAADREDAITREGERIAQDLDAIEQVSTEWYFGDGSFDSCAMIALLYASRLTKPPVGTADKLEQALRNLCSNINDAITREATARVDAREVE